MRAYAGCLRETIAAVIYSFMYSPDVLKSHFGKNYPLRTLAPVASCAESGRAEHAKGGEFVWCHKTRSNIL